VVDPDTRLLAGDLAGSVLMASRGALRHGFVFSAYGHDPVQAVVRAQLGFNGVIRELLTGCYLLGNGHRAFSPTLMRFHSPDGLSPFAAGGINAYGYCGGDPVNHVDPDGRMTKYLTAFTNHQTTDATAAIQRLSQIIENTPTHQLSELKNNQLHNSRMIDAINKNALVHAEKMPTIGQLVQGKATYVPPSSGITHEAYELIGDISAQGAKVQVAFSELVISPTPELKLNYYREVGKYIVGTTILVDHFRNSGGLPDATS